MLLELKLARPLQAQQRQSGRLRALRLVAAQ
jgi:hypothetical protein